MLNHAFFLTLVTLAGLVLGFAREWLLVADWGAGGRTDAYLVALFLPEAIRTMLGAGLLSAAALPLYQAHSSPNHWLAGQIKHFLLLGLALATGMSLFAPYWIKLSGMGLSASDAAEASQALRYLAWVIPGLLLQAVLTIAMQAKQRFVLPGLASFAFNLPVVIYLLLAGKQADPIELASCFILGSILMVLPLLPGVWQMGYRPGMSAPRSEFFLLWRQLWPLLSSSLASQGLSLLERFAASFLGEGAITLLNLARKLVNIPLIALMSLNHVLLAKMSGEGGLARRQMLYWGLLLCTLFTLPAAWGLIAAAPALVQRFLPAGLAQGPLPYLLALFAVSIVFGSWNALLARYYYAAGDTRTPLLCELSGGGIQAFALCTLTAAWGIWGITASVWLGVLSTGWLLCRKIDHSLLKGLYRRALLALILCSLAPLNWQQEGALVQLLLAGLGAGLLFAAGGVYCKREWAR